MGKPINQSLKQLRKCSKKKMKVKKFKIRCHAINEIMAGTVGLTDVQKARIIELETRKKDHAAGVDKVKPLTPNMEKELAGLIYKRDNPELPEGAKTYVKKWLKQQLFHRKPDFKAIVVDKGLACEPMGIALLSEILGVPLEKNDEFFENEFMEGEPDIVQYLPDGKKKVRDIKNSWDLFTFPMFEEEIPNDDYEKQLQGYMILTGAETASLDYTLINTPDPLMYLDLKKVYYQSGGLAEDWTPERYEALYPNYRFDDIPKHLRLKSFEVKLDPTLKGRIEERVIMCRKFIEELLSDVKQLEEATNEGK